MQQHEKKTHTHARARIFHFAKARCVCALRTRIIRLRFHAGRAANCIHMRNALDDVECKSNVCAHTTDKQGHSLSSVRVRAWCTSVISSAPRHTLEKFRKAYPNGMLRQWRGAPNSNARTRAQPLLNGGGQNARTCEAHAEVVKTFARTLIHTYSYACMQILGAECVVHEFYPRSLSSRERDSCVCAYVCACALKRFV